MRALRDLIYAVSHRSEGKLESPVCAAMERLNLMANSLA
jgi:hypothetical protein